MKGPVPVDISKTKLILKNTVSAVKFIPWIDMLAYRMLSCSHDIISLCEIQGTG